MADGYQLNPYDGDMFPGEDTKLFRDATKELDKKERFSLVDSDPVFIAIVISEGLSHVYWNKICTIATVYNNNGVGSNFDDLIYNSDDLTLQQVRDAAAVTWAKVDYISTLTPEMLSRLIQMTWTLIAQPFNAVIDPR